MLKTESYKQIIMEVILSGDEARINRLIEDVAGSLVTGEQLLARVSMLERATRKLKKENADLRNEIYSLKQQEQEEDVW